MKIKCGNNKGSIFVHCGLTGSMMCYFINYVPCWVLCAGMLVLHCRLKVAERGEAIIKAFSVETEAYILNVAFEMLKCIFLFKCPHKQVCTVALYS